jgi:hypothetical protein
LLKKPPVSAHEEHERCAIAVGSGPLRFHRVDVVAAINMY